MFKKIKENISIDKLNFLKNVKKFYLVQKFLKKVRKVK